MVTNDLSQDQRMHRICSTLSASGFKLTLVGRLRKDSIGLQEYSFDTKRIKCFFNSGFLFYAEYNLRLLMYLLTQHVDIINSVDLDTLIAGRVASVLKRTQFVFDAHELFTEVPELNGRRFRKWVWSMVQKIFVSGAMDCYTVNEQLAVRLTKQTGKDFGVVYNYPVLSLIGGKTNKKLLVESDISDNLNQFTKNELLSPIKLVYQGMLNTGRGLEEVIEAVQSKNKYELHIIGKGDIQKQITEMAAKVPNVHFHGFVEASTLHEKTSQYDIGLNLLIDSSDNYVYSSANKFFDYIMAGLPVISMNFPEYRKVNDKYDIGILIEDLNKDTILKAIDTIHQNYAVYSQNCAKARQELNWATQEDVLLEIYRGKA